IGRARAACARNESERIVVAIPKQPVPLVDAILELRALRHIERSPEKQTFTVQDNAALVARLKGDGPRPGAEAALASLRDQLMNEKQTAWCGKHATPLPTNNTKPADAANRVMDLLYGEKRNQFVHDDFNKLRA